MKPTFEATDDGITIVDQIERHRYQLTTPAPVSPEPVTTDWRPYPVDAAVAFSTEAITLPTNNHVHIRDRNGELITEAKPPTPTSVLPGEHTLEISAPLKLYVTASDSLSVYFDADRTHIVFDGETRVVVGARSYHTRPAETITTTTAPTDLMDAVTAFGSALKTTAPDRSYPTLRGHPPTITIGETLVIPDEIRAPDTGVTIAIPPTLSHIYTVTPLAYYLGATVVPGSSPQLRTKHGVTYPLDGDGTFRETVNRILKHVFFLDCLVRTEGITPLPLHERDVSESSLGFDPQVVYETDLPTQLETYLDLPLTQFESQFPDWRLETYLQPTIASSKFLPFIANNLSIVTIQEGDEPSSTAPTQQAVTAFTRSGSSGMDTAVRGTENETDSPDTTPPTIHQTWQRPGTTKIQSTVPLAAFDNSIGQTPRAPPIEIDVVCNDSAMHDELETVNGVYGTHEDLPFTVTVHYDVTVTELVEILASDSDFFHYIGHINRDGFSCVDGVLDGASIPTVGVKAFFLNACQSHTQGLNLLSAGSIGGIVTHGEIVNSGATTVGSQIARLLNHGFPLYAALSLARTGTTVGEQYQIVGDGTTTIAQSTTGVPTVCSMTDRDEQLTVTLETYEDTSSGIGSVVTPHLEPIDQYHLLPGRIEELSVTPSQLREFLALKETPLLVDDEIDWSGTIDDCGSSTN